MYFSIIIFVYLCNKLVLYDARYDTVMSLREYETMDEMNNTIQKICGHGTGNDNERDDTFHIIGEKKKEKSEYGRVFDSYNS